MRNIVNAAVLGISFLALVGVSPAYGAKLKQKTPPKPPQQSINVLANRVATKAVEGEKNVSEGLMRLIKDLASGLLEKNKNRELFIHERPVGIDEQAWAIQKAALRITWATVVDLGLNQGECSITQYGVKAIIMGPCSREKEIQKANLKLNGVAFAP